MSIYFSRSLSEESKYQKDLKPYNERMIELEIEMKKYKNLDEFAHMKEYNEVVFNYNYYNSNQKALKIYMNTIYGEIGNFNSFICAVEVAASLTTMGKYNLQLAKIVAEENFVSKTYYGDTDRIYIYITCNKSYFKDVDKLYFINQIHKLEYMT